MQRPLSFVSAPGTCVDWWRKEERSPKKKEKKRDIPLLCSYPRLAWPSLFKLHMPDCKKKSRTGSFSYPIVSWVSHTFAWGKTFTISLLLIKESFLDQKSIKCVCLVLHEKVFACFDNSQVLKYFGTLAVKSWKRNFVFFFIFVTKWWSEEVEDRSTSNCIGWPAVCIMFT